MKKPTLWLLALLGCLCPCLLGAQGPTPKSISPVQAVPAEIKKIWGDSICKLMQIEADSAIIYHLGLERDSSHFSGYAEMSRKKLSLKESKQFKNIFLSKKSYDFDKVKKCGFEPAVAVRFYRKNQTVDFILDIGCNILKVNGLFMDFEPSQKKLKALIRGSLPAALEVGKKQYNTAQF